MSQPHNTMLSQRLFRKWANKLLSMITFQSCDTLILPNCYTASLLLKYLPSKVLPSATALALLLGCSQVPIGGLSLARC